MAAAVTVPRPGRVSLLTVPHRHHRSRTHGVGLLLRATQQELRGLVDAQRSGAGAQAKGNAAKVPGIFQPAACQQQQRSGEAPGGGPPQSELPFAPPDHKLNAAARARRTAPGYPLSRRAGSGQPAGQQPSNAQQNGSLHKEHSRRLVQPRRLAPAVQACQQLCQQRHACGAGRELLAGPGLAADGPMSTPANAALTSIAQPEHDRQELEHGAGCPPAIFTEINLRMSWVKAA